MFTPKHDTLRFFVGGLDGKYVAVSKSSPCFCVEGKTEDEAIKAALGAWSFYLQATGKKSEVHIKQRASFNSIVKSFIPQQSVLAEAC